MALGTRPHPYVITTVIASLVLDGSILIRMSQSLIGLTFLPWVMIPQELCLFLSLLRPLKKAAIFGSAAALAFDLYVYGGMFYGRMSSTSALAFIFVPMWNAAIVVPAATFIAWVARRLLKLQED